MNGQAGKGDKYRPYDRARFEANYEAIFGQCSQYGGKCKQKSNRAKCECPRKPNSK